MTQRKYILHLQPEHYAICRLPAQSRIPSWAEGDGFSAIVRTEDELSIVCLKERVPDGIRSEREWRVFKVEGPLDFSQIGVLAALSGSLAHVGVSIFVISTYETDYLMVIERHLTQAVEALEGDGHQVLIS